MNEIGDAGESRNILTSVSRLIAMSAFAANAEGPELLAESAIQVRELDENGSATGVLANSGSVRDSDGKRGVRAQVGASSSKEGAAEYSTAYQYSRFLANWTVE